MEKQERIQHEGIVKSVSAQTVEVLIVSNSACSGCHAKGACGMAGMKQKTIMVPNSGEDIKVGDNVTVYASLGNAFYSVCLAYVIPSFLIIATIFFVGNSGCSELVAALSSLLLLIAYFLVLYLSKNKISKKIKFTIAKKENH